MKACSAGAPVPWVMAAAMAAAESALAKVGPLSDVAVKAAELPSADAGVVAAASTAALPAVPCAGLALSAAFPAPARTRAG
jgi:hypothetical protein